MKTNGLFLFFCVLVVNIAVADTTPTSQKYVDDALATKENILTPKTVDTLVTFPRTDGTSTERQIKSALDNSTTDPSVVTAGAANDKIDTRQDKVLNLPAANVLTYSSTTGTIVPKQIYSDNNTLGDGLVTAQTLNDAVVTAVNSELTQVDENGNESANGTLWRLNDTPHNLDAVTFDTVTGTKTLTIGKNGIYTIKFVGGIGTFGRLGAYVINGRARMIVGGNYGCSTMSPTVNRTGYVMDNSVLNGALGTYCYCPLFASLSNNDEFEQFVYLGEVELTTKSGTKLCNCMTACAAEINNNPEFRKIVFGGYSI